MDEMMKISGSINFTPVDGQINPARAQKTLDVLQELMNELGIISIDVSVNPWQKGPMKVQSKGPIINLN